MTTKPQRSTNKYNGIWFFGLSGSGKSYASSVCLEYVQDAFKIDGDDVRRLISFDLGYAQQDRHTQITRVAGLAELVIHNKRIPIISTVSMSRDIHERCSKLGIKVVQIVRPLRDLRKLRSIYESDINVVGKDIDAYEEATLIIQNDGTEGFRERIKAIAE